MATITKGKTFVNGELVTPEKLHQLVDAATLSPFVNADISTTAAIALSKLATGALPTAITVASANIVDGTIVNADISTTAAIADSKLAQITTAGKVLPAAVQGTAVITTDSRLSDARTPTTHTHDDRYYTETEMNNLLAGKQASGSYAPATGIAATAITGTAVITTDTRLSNARTPTTHTHAAADIASGTLAIARIPTGTTATTVCIGNDSRLSDARTPTTHTHAAADITSGTLANARTTATNANTANAIVARDASGNFSVGAIDATNTLTGSGLRVRWPDENSNAASGFEQNPSIGHTLKINCGRNAPAGREFINFVRVNSSGDTTILGTITAQGSPFLNSVAYNTTSDYRLKTNIEPLTAAVARLLQIPVHRFHFIGGEAGTKVDGFLAHEAQAVVPESVTGTKDEVDADGKPIYQGIDQSKLVPLLAAAVQELAARVAALEAK